jgi:hypothetical protein
MRHSGQNETSKGQSDTPEGTSATLADLHGTPGRAAGKHRGPAAPLIPEQVQPTHDMAPEAPAPVAPDQAEAQAEAPDDTRELARKLTRGSRAAAELQVPHTAQWTASHLPRTIAGSLLALAVVGTTVLAVRYAQSRASDDFTALAIGLGVVATLWAVVIASTPQVVSLDGPVLAVRKTGGSETFDLSDGLQAVDLVGDPRTSYWAVLLHRPNSTTVVLRGHDVNATELDPIVRHYRIVATRRFTEPEARFGG